MAGIQESDINESPVRNISENKLHQNLSVESRESYEHEPTEEEMATLRRIADKLPTAVWLVAVVELCERFTYYGVNGPFTNYMQYKPTDGTPGALGLGQSHTSALSYFFQFWCYVTPIIGAYIADTYLGKYKTIFYFALVYVVGCLILFVTSLPVAIANNASLGGLVVAMIVIGLGTGGIKSNVSPLIAEQYTNTKPFLKTLKSGERVIVDPSTTIETIFLVFYFCINTGSLSAIATTELEMNVGFWAAYLLPFCFFFVGIIALVLGRKRYVIKPPMGSVIPDCFRIIFIGVKNKGNFDAAKPTVREISGEPPVKWTDLYVEEVKRALKACKVFVFYPVYWIVYGQMINNFVSQAGEMETHGIPNDIMQNIDPIVVIIFIPILNKLVYPYLRKMGIKFKPITRITCGFFFGAIAMAYAAVVQHLIYTAGPCYDSPLNCPASPNGSVPNRVHVAVQAPAYLFIALSEIFASVTGLEYAYTKAPANMKSFIMSMFLLTNAFGSAIGIAISPGAKDPHMVWMYTGLSVATFFSGIVFWFLFKKYNLIEEEMNVLDAEYKEEQYLHITEETHIEKEKEQSAV